MEARLERLADRSALGTVAAVLLFRWFLDPILGEAADYVLVLCALMLLAVIVRPGPFIAAAIVGLLAATLGRQDEAIAHLGRAVQVNERAGALAWLTQSLHDRAAALLARDGPGDRESTAVSLARARALALRLGMQGIAAAGDVLARRFGEEVTPDASFSRQVLRRERDHWTVEYEGRACRLRDSKGMHLLVHLLRHPGQEFHAASLVAAASGAALEPDIPALDRWIKSKQAD